MYLSTLSDIYLFHSSHFHVSNIEACVHWRSQLIIWKKPGWPKNLNPKQVLEVISMESCRMTTSVDMPVVITGLWKAVSWLRQWMCRAHVSWWCVAARSVSEEFSSGCEGKSSAGSTGAPADQEHRPDHKQHRDKTPDDRDEGTKYTYLIFNNVAHQPF